MEKTDYGFNKVAVYGLLRRQMQYLMLRRANTNYMEGMYSLPAGRVEPGETLTGALVRELKEEIGITVVREALKPVHFAQRVPDSYIDVFYEVSSWEGDPYNAEPGKASDLDWFFRESLPEDTIPFIRQVIGRIITGQVYSEYQREP